MGDPLNLSSLDDGQVNGYCRHRASTEAIVFLEACRSTSICGPDATMLRPDPIYFLDRLDLLWATDWFPRELVSPELRLTFVDQNTYTVNLNLWKNVISSLFERETHEDWVHLQHEAEIISKFEGWAFCISEEDEAKIPEFIAIRLKLPKEIFSSAMAGDMEQGNQKVGRPSLDKARAEFARMKYDKGNRSWTQLANHLERTTGERPSPKTMRDWISQYLSLNPPGEN